jgi:hypothetical protein
VAWGCEAKEERLPKMSLGLKLKIQTCVKNENYWSGKNRINTELKD